MATEPLEPSEIPTSAEVKMPVTELGEQGARITLAGPAGTTGPAGPAGVAGPAGEVGPEGTEGLPGETSGGSLPVAFLARSDGTAGAGLTIGPNAWFLLNGVCLNSEVLDTDNAYNLATGRFQPPVGGYYFLMAAGSLDGMGTNQTMQLMLNRNGNLTGGGRVIGPRGRQALNYLAAPFPQTMTAVSGMMYLNGTTDYAEVRMAHSANVNYTTTLLEGFMSFGGFFIRA